MDEKMRGRMKQKCHGLTRNTLSGPGETTWMTCPAHGVDPNNPFKSKSQQGWMFANKPKMAKKWAKETPNIKSLPKKVLKSK